MVSDIPSPNSGFVAISANMWYSLALKDDGTVVIWGDKEKFFDRWLRRLRSLF